MLKLLFLFPFSFLALSLSLSLFFLFSWATSIVSFVFMSTMLVGGGCSYSLSLVGAIEGVEACWFEEEGEAELGSIEG